MEKRLLPVLLAVVLLLGGCAQAPAEDGKLHILATTYPVYLFTTALTDGIEDVEVSLLVNSQTSCLHDYTLTVENMKAIERADVIIISGMGLEEFMEDPLTQSDAAVIDASTGFRTFYSIEDGEEADPHIWMFPNGAMFMLESISQGLTDQLPEWAAVFQENYDDAFSRVLEISDLPSGLHLITFHDGFSYFAAYSQMYLKAIEEEEGSTASAAEIKEVVALINEYHIPAIFVEKNGSSATAEVIARETGCQVRTLDMLMSGDGTGIQPYIDAMHSNLSTVWEALK